LPQNSTYLVLKCIIQALLKHPEKLSTFVYVNSGKTSKYRDRRLLKNVDNFTVLWKSNCPFYLLLSTRSLYLIDTKSTLLLLFSVGQSSKNISHQPEILYEI